jgi:zinc D-Ala-D-Ala carboxypeptidase
VNALGIPADYAASRGLTLQVEATDLIRIGSNAAGRDILLSPPTAAAWDKMRLAASESGVTLLALSGFRSIGRQAEIIRAKRSAGETMEAILRVMAAPGYSEHHTGRAIDIGALGDPPLTEDFARTPAFQWLGAHASAYGFGMSYPRGNPHGIGYEPWHWYFRGDGPTTPG